VDVAELQPSDIVGEAELTGAATTEESED
jgi:hypothetical protein